MSARTQAIDPALNQLGQIATAVAQSANTQQASGLDLNGQLGSALFSVGAPVATASSANTDATTASVTLTNIGALTSDNYLLSYKAGAYTLTDATTGANVALTGAGTGASPLTASSVGLSIVLSGTPASGDQFLIQPTAQAASTIGVAITDPSGLAAAGAIQTSAADTNAGSATISAGTVLDPTNPNLLNTTTIQFLTPTTYSVNGAGSFAYTSGGDIDLNGWQVKISGTPAAGDTFTVQSNAGGTGDNTNALAAANQQTAGVLSNGTISISGARGRADQRRRRPGAAGQHRANGADGGEHAGDDQRAIDLRGQSRRGGGQSHAVAAGLSSLRASAVGGERPVHDFPRLDQRHL